MTRTGEKILVPHVLFPVVHIIDDIISFFLFTELVPILQYLPDIRIYTEISKVHVRPM